MEWSYTGPTGPEHWGALSPDYAPCGQGVQQSPIDITGYEHSVGPGLSFSYDGGVSSATLVRGSIVVEFGSGNSLLLGDRRYELLSAHAHAPAEHTVDGERFGAELHVVHEDASGEALVVGVLYRLGGASPVLQAMLDAAAGETTGFPLDAAAFMPRSAAFYNYPGSKTTPPCHEPVEWVVMRDAGTASQEQLDALQSFSGGPNNRPLQPLRGRRVMLIGG